MDGRAGPRALSDPKEIRSWLNEHISIESESSVHTLPCSTAQQLRHLFGKYFRPDGTAKRKWVGVDAINRGTRYIQRPEEALEAALRSGYLTLDTRFHRYFRTDGPEYSEMVGFVRRFEASPDIRFLLDDICRETGCAHVVG